MTYDICTCYGHFGVKNRRKMAIITNMASKIIGEEHRQVGCFYNLKVKLKAHRILDDPKHLVADEFIKLPSGRHYGQGNFIETNCLKGL